MNCPTTNGSARSSAIYRTLRNYLIKFLIFIRREEGALKRTYEHIQDFRKLNKKEYISLKTRYFILSNPLNPPYQGDFKRKCVSPNIRARFESGGSKIGLLAPAEQHVYRILSVIQLHSSGVLCQLISNVHLHS